MIALILSTCTLMYESNSTKVRFIVVTSNGVLASESHEVTGQQSIGRPDKITSIVYSAPDRPIVV